MRSKSKLWLPLALLALVAVALPGRGGRAGQEAAEDHRHDPQRVSSGADLAPAINASSIPQAIDGAA